MLRMQATAGTWAPEKGKRNHYDGHIGHMDSTELCTINVPTCKTNPSVCLPPENTHMTERNGTERNGAERNGMGVLEESGTKRNGIRNGI